MKSPLPVIARPLLPALVVALLLGTTGCQIGPGALKVANAHYSDAVRIASSEQLLVNLVRLRYRDQPTFLAVSSISTQFEFGTSGSVSGTINESGPDVLGLGAGVDYSEKPTISFSIMGGENFQKRMLTPISVVAVARLAESGWRGDRVLRVTAEQINGLRNAPRASGPTPTSAPEFASFLEAVSLVQDLADRDLIEFAFETRSESISDPISIAQIEGSDLIDAAKANVEFIALDDKRVGLTVERRRLVIRVRREAVDDPGTARLFEMLALDPAARRIDVVDLEDSDFDPFDPDHRQTELGIDTRSLMGVLYYLSNGVKPPPEHVDASVVTRTVDGSGQPFDWDDLLTDLFAVHSSSSRPKNAAVAVRHRGYWFYIDDSDETSKSTFLLLNQIFTLQAGEVEDVKPLLTLPVG